MIVTLRRSVPLQDLADMLAVPSTLSLWTGVGPRALAARYCCYTRHWGFWAGERVVAAGGLYAHIGDGRVERLEAWFACRPEASRAIRSIARHMRLTLALIAETERVEIFARVASGWEPGRRLARAVGFRLLEAGAVETWGL